MKPVEESHKSSEKPFSLAVVLNRIYFGLYEKYAEIWTDLGKALRYFELANASGSSDYSLVAQTMKEAAIFLYIQWHALSLERYC